MFDDDKAFESLFYSLNTALIKFSMMYIHQKEVAEEIVSDVFVKCWVNRKSLGEVRNIDTYLFVAVKNQSLNHLKKYSHIHLVQVEDTNEVKICKTIYPPGSPRKKRAPVQNGTIHRRTASAMPHHLPANKRRRYQIQRGSRNIKYLTPDRTNPAFPSHEKAKPRPVRLP